MYLSLKGSLGHTPITDRVGEGPLQIAEGAAAAYSLRNLGSDSPSVVRVRRESDNNERDFTAQDISTSVLTNWVNQQITPPLDLRELTATGRDGPIIEAAAAYSLRNLSSSYTGSVVEVRRSSGGEPRSFTAAEVTDGTLEAWVTEEQVGWNVQPTWDVPSGDGVITSQSKTATTSTFSITTTSGDSLVRQSSKPNHVIASSGDQVVANITLSGFDADVSARLRTAGTNINVAQQTLSNGTADYTLNLTGSAGYFVFSNIEATSGATLTFNSVKVIGKSGTVSKWYDQSTTSGVPNAKHAVQTSAAKQPKIVDGGALVTGGLDFDGVNDGLSVGGQVLTSSSFYATSVVQHSTGTSTSDGQNVFGQYQVGVSGRFQLSANGSGQYSFFASATDSISGFNTGAIGTSQTLISVNGDGSNAEIWRDGTSKATDTYSGFTPATVDFTIGIDAGGERKFNGKIQELIIYPSAQSDNRTALEANIGEVYGIAGIPAYDDTVNGFVETWYDQSGNGNNATQLTASKQPKIVNAGALVTATNGLPAIRVLGNTQSLGLSQNLSFSDFSAFYVVKHQTIGTSISWLGDSSGGDYLRYTSTAYQIRAQNVQTAFINFDTTISSGNDYLLSAVRASNTLNLFIDGSAQANTVSSSGIFDVQKLFQRGGNTTQTLNGFAQELILYPTDQSANRPAIEANINNQYDIY